MRKRGRLPSAEQARKKRRTEQEGSSQEEKQETEEESDETDALLKDCPHVAGIYLDHIQPIVLDPVNWNCSECGTTEGIWVCLFCGHFGCGRFQQSHALAHHRATQHPVVLEVNERTAHCYLCQCYVVNDNKRGELATLRGFLEQIQTQSFPPSLTRSGHMIRSSSSFTLRPRDHKLEDKIFTAAKHWKLYALSKAFNTWKQRFLQASYESTTSPACTNDATRSVGRQSVDADKECREQLAEQQIPPKGKKETEEAENRPRRSRRRDISKELDLGTEFSRKYAVSAPQKSRTLIPGQTGLRNLGNTCFMNAVLQALSNVINFRQFFILEFEPVDKRGKLWRRNTMDCLQQIHAQQKTTKELSVSLELHNLLRVVWSGKWAVVTPFALLDATWKFLPRFRNYQQQDAQEFLVFLLDRLHDELKLKNTSQTTKPDEPTIISKTFQGQFRSEVICGKCDKASPTFENFLDLQLDIPVQHACQQTRGRKKIDIPSCHIEDCLQSFTQSEDLGEEAYFCERCRSKQSASKALTIERLPNVLCIVFKRFCWTDSSRAKIDTQVQFPLSGLDLSKYTTNNQEGAETFSLTAVVSHHGAAIQRGHYTSFCWNSERQSWLHFNDSRVSVVEAEEVQEQQAYILFYEREKKGVK